MYPPEIIDHILSYLQRDRAALKVCAKAHPCLSKLGERHLYAHITVQNVNNWNSDAYYPSDLLQLIFDNPDIARYVRSLRISLNDIPNVINRYEALESILPVLTQLHTVFLVSATGSPIDWHRLYKSFRTAFTNCLRLPTLTEVNISDVDAFPLFALDHTSSLKKLSLLGDFSNDFNYLPPVPPLVLDSLVLDNCSLPSVEVVTSWAETRTCRSLEFNCDLRSLSRLLGVCANTLTTLNFHVPPDFRTRYDLLNMSTRFTPIPFSLACLSHLARLTIQSSIILGQGPRSQDSCLQAIMHLLDTLPSPPTSLVLLVISISIYTGDTFGDVSDTNWEPLISFPYFDVIPTIELRVRAQKWTTHFPSVALFNTLKENYYLMQLERHHSFLINAVE